MCETGRGSGGKGVIRAEILKPNRNRIYRYQLGEKPRSFLSFPEFYDSMNRRKQKRSYLVQQGIHLLKKKGRPFDVRVMVQRTEAHPWTVTGMLGRLAHPKRIVTNYHSGGRPPPLNRLLQPQLRGPANRSYMTKLEKLSIKIANHLQQSYRGFREIGVDFGIDSRMRPWVLEVNTAPDAFVFNQLKDKRMFRKVLRYARANGRYRKAKR
ncbi:YheC/YheD family protein [Paenibacillus sp. P26]|nr:YheC/YheD family protein [Paenibacillus sp. P26]